MNLFFNCLRNSQAQEPVLHHYTVEDGLPSSLIYQVIEDEVGYIWISTDRGVARFDGYHFKKFTVKDGLPNNDIWGLKRDAMGKIWAATFNQPTYFEDGRFHAFPLAQMTPKLGKVEYYWMDEAGNHFLGDNADRLYFMNREDSLSLFQCPTNYSAFSFLTEYPQGTRWFFSKKKKFPTTSNRHLSIWKQIHEDSLQLFAEMPIEDPRELIFPTCLVRKTDALLFSKFHFFLFDFEKITKHSWSEFVGLDVEVLSISKMEHGQLFLNTTAGYKVLDEEFKVLEEFDFLNAFTINRIFEDSQGNIWICTSDDGVYFLTMSTRKSRSYRPALAHHSNDILSIAKDEENPSSIWMGTGKGQLFNWCEGDWKEVNIQHRTIRTDRILDMVFANGQLCLATDNGLLLLPKTILQNSKSTIITNQDFPNNDQILTKQYQHFFNSAKTVVKGIKQDLLVGLSYDAIQLSPIETGFKSTRLTSSNIPVYAIALDSSSNIWLGKKNGIELAETKEKQFLREEHALFYHPVNDLKVDNQNYLWVATDGFGLFRYKNGQVDTIQKMEEELVKTIFIDTENRIWAATNQGVRKIVVTNDSPFEYEYFRITTAHGLISSETNRVFVDGDNIYVGTKRGLTILQDTTITDDQEPPPLYFSKITINGKKVSLQDTFQLTHQQNNINIEYVCLSYQSTGNIDYWYQMEGIDPTWQQTTDLKKEYPTLDTRNYTFRLKARDINGTMTAEKSITFILHPAWWKTWWAILFFGLLIGAGGYFFIRWRVQRDRQASEMELEITKKFAELELEALQAQMNPHFIFNAMQSIQNFIFQKDERIANRYMVKFSRLMRLFLESSRSKYIRFEDELKLLQFYIELENMRFPEHFDFTIEVDASLENENIKIPSMLIQPFVENAINHGLLQKEEKGHLQIEMKMENGQFLCIVEDDGVGRKKAQVLRQESFKHHKSRGMQIIEERQRVLNLLSENTIDIQIIDKMGKHGEATGTRIEIRFNQRLA